LSVIHPVILCGGSGTRLWPSSRKAYPKQFSPLIGRESLFQQTLRRFSGNGFAAPLVLTNAEFRFLARDQAEAIGLADGRYVLEPEGRDTAPAILTAALMLADEPDALMLVAPSDHLIRRPEALVAALEAGAQAARAGRLVTFGITPQGPETAYGYLELAGPPQEGTATPLVRFVEKPDAATAGRMLASGRFLWNAGIFLFRPADIIAAFEAHAPAMLAPCRAALEGARTDLGFLRLDPQAYASVEARSIDYAVMEKAEELSVVPVEAGWSDLGSWASLHASLAGAAGEEGDGGVVTEGPVTAMGCENSLLRSEDDGIRLVGLGLKNTVAVAMRDAVLVADLGASQQVKEVVATLRAQEAPQADDYPRFHRPWGWYETLCISDRFQVKRIMVKPGASLSLQSHLHRSEHWVVVAGTARVTLGEEVRLVSENESVYIPLGTKHRLENPGKVAMYLIEVQTGSYLGEDDIHRYEDIYDRR
jgi:mannose-1-phosphate guanylyltransferase/mannose-1-phosphate guanylyltransferase/mannose-6-phosphate isomerase